MNDMGDDGQKWAALLVFWRDQNYLSRHVKGINLNDRV